MIFDSDSRATVRDSFWLPTPRHEQLNIANNWQLNDWPANMIVTDAGLTDLTALAGKNVIMIAQLI